MATGNSDALSSADQWIRLDEEELAAWYPGAILSQPGPQGNLDELQQHQPSFLVRPEILQRQISKVYPAQSDLDCLGSPSGTAQQPDHMDGISGDVVPYDVQPSSWPHPGMAQQVPKAVPSTSYFGSFAEYISQAYNHTPIGVSEQYLPELERPHWHWQEAAQASINTPTGARKNFMDLPQEMRDLVYDLLGHSTPDSKKCGTREGKRKTDVDEQDTDRFHGDGVRLSVSNGPATNMLLVLKQFNAEYTARIKLQATWVFSDTYGPIPLSVALEASTHPPQITTAKFQLISSCFPCQDSIPHGRVPENLGQDASTGTAAAAAGTATGQSTSVVAPANDLEECEIEREIGEQLAYIRSSLNHGFNHVEHYTIQLLLYDMPKKHTWPFNTGNKNLMRAFDSIVSEAELRNQGYELRGIEVVLATRDNKRTHLTYHGLDNLKDRVTVGTWTKKDGWQAAKPPEK